MKISKKQVLTVMSVMLVSTTFAQNAGAGAAGVDNAVLEILDYFPVIINLCYAIGGIIGLVGGIRIFQKWNSGDNDINKELIGYGGAMLFLVLVPNVVGAFFGI